MTLLSVNLNKVALVRNSRGGDAPNVVAFGRRALELGAGGLTVHPRPDARHIRPHDVFELAALIAEFRSFPASKGVEFNIEGNPLTGDNFANLVEKTRPHQVTLVPDSTDQLTSNAGWQLDDDKACRTLAELAVRYKALGCRVCVFVEPDAEHVREAAGCGVDGVELYTEHWAKQYAVGKGADGLKLYRQASQAAKDLSLRVNAGHDLNLNNLADFTLPKLDEVSIGHALFCDAIEIGWDTAVKAYLQAVKDIVVP